MPNYSVFGGCLSTDLPFPELSPESDATPPTWTLQLAAWRELPAVVERLGVVPDQACHAELGRASTGDFVFTHSCTGVFHVAGNGATIRYALEEQAPPDLVRGDILGRVIAVALHMRGVLSLHASAVALADGVIGFAAPKGHGKSTLSLALTCSGAKFVTDDLLPVFPGSPVMVGRGVQSVRLRDDSARLFLDAGAETRQGIDGKRIIDTLPGDRVSSCQAPLAAIYVLSPVERDAEVSAVRRTHLRTWQGAMELVRHARIGALLGGREAALVFDRASTIAQGVPVFSLQIARDLACLPEIVETIVGWHGGTLSAAPNDVARFRRELECCPRS